MKKLALTTVCALFVTGAAFAQGNVNWSGPSFSFFTAQTNSTTYSTFSKQSGGLTTGGGVVGNVSGNTAVVGQGYYFELLYLAAGTQQAAPTTVAGLQAWSDTGLGATNNGNVSGRAAVINGNVGTTVNAFTPGTSVNVVMVGWSANLGTSWSTVEGELVSGNYAAGADYFGVSSTGFIDPSTAATSPGATIFGGGAGQLSSTLTQLNLLNPSVIPEPGTMALAGLGGLSLLAFRRKK
jgi:hypothetical protein